eukprot:m.87064 g.87064  ORF g.87064 m.87064 type:complete len:531 (-) comp13577_c0_seq2:23-1615(-)
MASTLLVALLFAAASAARPNIFAVIIDDFGWGNVGFHRTDGSKEVQTPNMDALVKQGVLLNRHYVHMMCTPSRSSFQSGRLPVHVQLTLAGPCCAQSGIPRNMTTIAAKMASAGYDTHFVGKWDAGSATPQHTPFGRGYRTSLNYFSHGNWAWTQAAWEGSYVNRTALPVPGVRDLWDTTGPANKLNGTGFEEDLFFNRISTIINGHSPSRPLFLVYAARMVHYPLQVPLEFQQRFSFIDEPHRRMYAAMVSSLDFQIGRIQALLAARGLWENTLMVLTADNGGYVEEVAPCNLTSPHGIECFSGEAGASNFPLRGGKYSPFEGGIRSNAFVSGGFLPDAVRGTTQNGIVHIADWYHTFCGLAGVDPTDHAAARAGLPPIDSLDVWPLLSGRNNTSPRTEILVREDTLVQGRYKLIVGDITHAGWAGPQYPNMTSEGKEVMRVNLTCNPGCLFDVQADPTEHHNLAPGQPARLHTMLARLRTLNSTIWRRHMPPEDPACNATAYSRYGGFLGPWLHLSSQERAVHRHRED